MLTPSDRQKSQWLRLGAHALGVAGALSGAITASGYNYSGPRIVSIALISYFAAYGIAHFSAEVASMLRPGKR